MSVIFAMPAIAQERDIPNFFGYKTVFSLPEQFQLEKVSIGHGCPSQMPFRKRVYM